MQINQETKELETPTWASNSVSTHGPIDFQEAIELAQKQEPSLPESTTLLVRGPFKGKLEGE